MKLIEQHKGKDDPDPKAFACFGLDIRMNEQQDLWLRFVEGNPNSDLTIQFLQWVLEKTTEEEFAVLLMFWDHASWHKSKKVQSWIRKYNQQVKATGKGTRLLACLLPKKSPWLNPIEPRWAHAKRKVVAPDRKLTALELAERICAVFKQVMLPWLTISNQENVC